MTWGPLGGQKSLNNRPIPDFWVRSGGRGQSTPSHEAGYSPTPPFGRVPPHAAPGYGGSYRHPWFTLSLTKNLYSFCFGICFKCNFCVYY